MMKKTINPLKQKTNSRVKNFKEFREQVTYNKSINKVPVKIQKTGNKFIAYVDGDKLDTYRSEAEALKMAKEFIKQYKG